MVEAPSDRDKGIRPEVISENNDGDILSTLRSTLPALPIVEGRPLRFASGEALAPPVVRAKPKARTRRRPRVDPFDMAVVVLIITCAAVCVYRLFWAIQP